MSQANSTKVVALVNVGNEAKTVKFIAWSGKGFKRVIARARNLPEVYVQKSADGSKFVASTDKKGTAIIAIAPTPQDAFAKAVKTAWVQ